MKSLIIGDVHNLIDLVDKVVEKYGHLYDEIVIVGDYFDSYGDNKIIAERTTHWLKEKVKLFEFKMIWGNHDLHYKFFRNQQIKGSGYSRNKSDAINKIMKWEDWHELFFFYETQGFVISHAGIGPHLAHPIKGIDLKVIKANCYEDYNNALNEGVASTVFRPGVARGGEYGKGGLTWLDWDHEFEPISGFNQIVGHSHSEQIRYKNYNGSINVNVDCLPYYVLSIEDGKLSEIKLNIA